MTDSTEIFQKAISFDWEALIPILFFVLYGLAQFLGSRKSPPEEAEEARKGDSDPMDRARQIREEIRRKIEERAQTAESRKADSQTAQSRQRPAYDPRVPENQQQRKIQPSRTAQSAGRGQPAASQPSERSRPVVQEARPVMASQASSIEERLKRQRERLAEARKRQEEARSEARRIEQRAGVRRRSPPLKESTGEKHADLVSLGTFRSQVIAGLRQPNTIRKAVLYREILDPPLGLR